MEYYIGVDLAKGKDESIYLNEEDFKKITQHYRRLNKMINKIRFENLSGFLQTSIILLWIGLWAYGMVFLVAFLNAI